MKMTLFLLGAFLLAVSCSQQTANPENKMAEVSPTETEKVRYTTDMVVNTKDYACGMPTSAGISDTCHYQGKAYGFCSSECKAEFQKDPEKFLASNQ
jgi:YHS domain-containing protein